MAVGVCCGENEILARIDNLPGEFDVVVHAGTIHDTRGQLRILHHSGPLIKPGDTPSFGR
jgi:hypothetical protein